jgi:hypothetical protein
MDTYIKTKGGCLFDIGRTLCHINPINAFATGCKPPGLVKMKRPSAPLGGISVSLQKASGYSGEGEYNGKEK